MEEEIQWANFLISDDIKEVYFGIKVEDVEHEVIESKINDNRRN